METYTLDALKDNIKRDDYKHQGSLPNDFSCTIASRQQALKAICTFKNEYLLDFINVEEIESL